MHVTPLYPLLICLRRGRYYVVICNKICLIQQKSDFRTTRPIFSLHFISCCVWRLNKYMLMYFFNSENCVVIYHPVSPYNRIFKDIMCIPVLFDLRPAIKLLAFSSSVMYPIRVKYRLLFMSKEDWPIVDMWYK